MAEFFTLRLGGSFRYAVGYLIGIETKNRRYERQRNFAQSHKRMAKILAVRAEFSALRYKEKVVELLKPVTGKSNCRIKWDMLP
jgi:hypothetical protein